MNKFLDCIEKIKKTPHHNFVLLEELLEKIKKILKGKRKIMYSDIINVIIREGFNGENHKQLLLWCNYKIRLGGIFVEF